MLDMIRAISSSDYDFRESYNNAVRSPVYDDQLLQHESSVDVDAINTFNEAHGKKSKNQEVDHEAEKIEEASKDLRKPRLVPNG